MAKKLTQHKISSLGEVLDFLRSGNRTILESIEFDVSVGKSENNTPVIEIGHPKDLREGNIKSQDAAEFIESVAKLAVKQLVIDVKAKDWNQEKGKAEFQEGDLDILLRKLPEIIESYLEKTGDYGFDIEVVLGSVQEEFFEELKKKEIDFDPAVKTRFFSRD